MVSFGRDVIVSSVAKLSPIKLISETYSRSDGVPSAGIVLDIGFDVVDGVEGDVVEVAEVAAMVVIEIPLEFSIIVSVLLVSKIFVSLPLPLLDTISLLPGCFCGGNFCMTVSRIQ